ncbi:glycosyltransferase [Terrisporobacter petrolearius]|uniref:glycosyltransferase n=1 Tax=Terrisporobacter petrolearius TaxID=1460447 RepID=UPI001D164061|nr:glycosyltransferase [Terrisporobacter petrolearius]MCC3862836.1 glycosyltransferase [Terrisporobacter petrolearius]
MEQEIKVSINCITYNHETYIEKAIQSFLMQKTNFKYEILIHDDASTDSTQKIIKKYEKEYPNIVKPLLQKENQWSKGVTKINYSFNHTRSNGKYIAICEGDDYWSDPYKLQKQIDYMESNPNCTLCTHAVARIDTQSEKITDIIRPSNSNSYIDTREFILGGGMFIGTNSIVYRKEALDNPPKWYFDAPVGDYPLQIFLASKGDVYYIDDVMSVYRVNVPGSWSNRVYFSPKRINHFKKISKMLDAINEYTDYKYNKEIETRKENNLKDVIFYGCSILMENGRIDKMTSGKFKKFYNMLRDEEKIALYVAAKEIKF